MQETGIEMTSNHIADIGAAFDYLFQNYGFGIGQQVQFESFGNWVVVLESPDCRVRILQDRGQISVAFGPVWSPRDWEAGPWFDLQVIFGYLSIGYTQTHEFATNESLPRILGHLARALEPNMPPICALFQAESFASHQHELERITDDYKNSYWDELLAKE